MSNYVPRVVQLDTLVLDSEFYSLIENQLFQVFNLFQVGGFTQTYAAEVKLFLKFFIWKLTVFRKNSSIGQALLGVKYANDKGKLKLLFALEAVLPYIYERVIQRSRSNVYYRKAEKPLKYVENGIKVIEIVNFCVFLMQNRYPTLINRILRLKIIPIDGIVNPSVGYSYQLREMLWHQFADFLMIVLPLVNIHRLRRYLRQWGISSLTGTTSVPKVKAEEMVLKCCLCKEDAVIPQRNDNCTFCYYCLKANVIADSEFRCISCCHSSEK